MSKLSKLQLVKLFAKLEGVTLAYSDNIGGWSSGTPYGKDDFEYDPIKNIEFNCSLRDKYEVEICYRHKEVAVWIESTWIKVEFKTKRSIPRSVIKCILKSKGLI